jgi:hypothetical protein
MAPPPSASKQVVSSFSQSAGCANLHPCCHSPERGLELGFIGNPFVNVQALPLKKSL